jgi:putative membrane protein
MELTLISARRLQVTDLVLGIAAGLLLFIGLLRVFLFEKGPDYYWHSHAFLTKFTLFVVMALVSIIPTLEFLSWGGALKAGQVPVVGKKLKLVTAVIHGELLAIVIILLCAAIMARGGWV